VSFLDPPRCPNCNSELDLKALWQAAPKNRGMVLSDRVGIVCPVCGVKLRVTQGRVQVSTILVFVVPFALALLVNRIVPLGTGMPSAKIGWITLAAIYIGGFILQGRLSPRLLRLRLWQRAKKSPIHWSVLREKWRLKAGRSPMTHLISRRPRTIGRRGSVRLAGRKIRAISTSAGSA
jgi:hypothetical protein